ncbi:MAG: hypothetical protein DRR04_05490 [Gammaproteobacteria bacterium]|nr:MAG: hypothetical protein DRQ97_07925 [Gammaproteobacteria bacterium]RLA60486.1 MAG: hypothetical protein DRR04_05490 [Gammaproteobacteria bacterium]
MNRPVKATLLSALVFPGAGHFFLKRYIPGSVLAGSASLALYILVSKAVERAVRITDKIQRGEVELDVAAITELISNHPAGPEDQILSIATAGLLLSWLIGIVDSYRAGRAA